MNARALVIMAKAPIAGSVKTRLCPPLADEEAAELYSCLLRDKVRQATNMRGCQVVLAYHPPRSEQLLTEMQLGCELLAQRGESLEARLRGVGTRLTERGFETIVFSDTDSPFVVSERFERAFYILQASQKTVVLGPSTDGGYYLIGMRPFAPALVQDISWSTPEVAGQTLRRANVLGLSVLMLPSERDIDTPEDLVWLEQNARLPQLQEAAPNTAAWLTSRERRSMGEETRVAD